MTRREILKTAVAALEDKKGNDIQLIHVREQTIIADYFIIASGTSSTQVKTLAEEVEFKLEEAGIRPTRVEGKSTSWILLDYADVIVHVFHEKAREFYALERLWSDGEPVELSSLEVEESVK